jgi:hypothetical protein
VRKKWQPVVSYRRKPSKSMTAIVAQREKEKKKKEKEMKTNQQQ